MRTDLTPAIILHDDKPSLRIQATRSRLSANAAHFVDLGRTGVAQGEHEFGGGLVGVSHGGRIAHASPLCHEY